ncbi:MAG: ribosome biogenesis GTPase Der [Campylobacterales bacterium]|nr:ribosome biogenesis GTPase Der [Campylobacterales bacterium]
MKKIALVGKPNAGKSSLFNRFLKFRDAITSDVAGTTRDVKKREAQFGNESCELIDTGGLEDRNDMFKDVKKKAIEAATTSDIILYVIDSKVAPDEEDKKLFYSLQKEAKQIALIVNKVDNDAHKDRLFDFYAFGADNFFPISASHNRGVGELEIWIENELRGNAPVILDQSGDDFDNFLDNFDDSGELIPEMPEEEEEDKDIKVAIIGRPNVGKSSLLNALIGEERSVVSPIAGTTIDPVDEIMTYNNQQITFVDTAGIRKRSKILGIEKLGLNRTEKMLEKADIALLTLDVSAPFMEQDEKVAGLIEKYGLGCIIVLNKYDIAHDEYEKLEEEIRLKFRFLEYAPIVTVSALTKKRTHKLNDMILNVYENYTRRVTTSKFNEIIKNAMIKHHPPAYNKTKALKIYYATQFEIKPPRFALVCNYPKGFHFSYLRYLKNQIREAIDFEGTPVVLIPRQKGGTRNADEANDENII